MPRSFVFLASCAAAYALLSACALSEARADQPIRPCSPGDPELVSAERELTQIDSAVAALEVAADPRPLAARIQSLAETRCLRMLGGLTLSPSSGLALKTYWAEGGSEHLRSYLDLGKPGEHWLWLAPTMRQALTLETNPTSPIRELLCPFAEVGCGVEARGWAIRAEHEFVALAARASTNAPDSVTKNGEPVDCERLALRAAYKDRFSEFRACEEEQRTARVALPIGRLRALDHGWLIVQGRRGHYAFCDEIRAYDLATGSAYRVASCCGLVLQSGGNVDFRATDAQRQATLEMGHLPLLALCEAAWMLLLVDQVDQRVVDGYGVHLPSALPHSVADGGMLLGLSATFHFTSADTQLAWRVAVDANTLKAGTLTWSPAPLDDPAAEHAVTLLRVAEASWVQDCPDVPPPAAVTRREPTLSASRLDADGASLGVATKAAADDWQRISERQRTCSRASAGSHAPAAAASRASASRR